MNAENIILFAQELGLTYSCPRGQNIYVSCPLAPFTHPSGKDTSNGLAIKVCDHDLSVCCCWNPACNFRGSMLKLASLLYDFSGGTQDFRSTVNHLEKYDGIEALLSLIDRPKPKPVRLFSIDDYRKLPILPEGTLDIYNPAISDFDLRLREDSTFISVVYPIYSISGDLVGGADRRIFNKTNLKTYAKYKNWEDSQSKKHLFGEHLLTDFRDQLIVLEGPYDATMAYNHLGGDVNCVATLGAHISDEQIRILVNNCNELVICLDSDIAGEKGMIKLLSKVGGRNVSFMHTLPFKDAGDCPSSVFVKHYNSRTPVTFL